MQQNSKRMRLAKYPDLESALLTWFEQAIASKRVTIDGPTLQLQAAKYATMLGHTDFDF